MKRTLPKSPTQALERDGFIQMLLNVPADSFDRIGLRITAEKLRTATQAGAVARLLRLIGTREEFHILASRTARRTRWPAIDASRRDGEDELSVVAAVARDHGVPALLVAQLGRLGIRGRHFVDSFLCEYGIRPGHWESHVCSCHGKARVRRTPSSGLSESCGQSEELRYP